MREIKVIKRYKHWAAAAQTICSPAPRGALSSFAHMAYREMMLFFRDIIAGKDFWRAAHVELFPETKRL